MLPSMSYVAVPPSKPEYVFLSVAYVVLLPLNLTKLPCATEMVAPSDVEVMEVHAPLSMLYSMVLARLPNDFQQIVPGVSTLKVR